MANQEEIRQRLQERYGDPAFAERMAPMLAEFFSAMEAGENPVLVAMRCMDQMPSAEEMPDSFRKPIEDVMRDMAQRFDEEEHDALDE